MNIADAIGHQARTRPDAAALLQGDWSMDYAGLDAATRHIAADLAARGIAPGDVVGIAMDTTPLHLLVVVSLARLGAVSIAVNPESPRAQRKAIVDHFGVVAIIASRKQYAVDSISLIPADPAWLEQRPSGDLGRSSEAGGRPWSIHLTSGTTGTPKGIMRTHADALELLRLRESLARTDPDSRFLCRMSLSTVAVQMRVLLQLLAGSAVVFSKTPQLGDAFEAIERHRVTHTFASPIMLGRWVTVLSGSQPRFPHLHLVSGGSLMSASLSRDIIERMTPNLSINYGVTETGLVATADPDTHRRYPDSVGRTVPWVEAQVVDDRDQPVPAGTAGNLRFRGPGVAGGYHLNPEATAKSFRDGWFYSSDLARYSPEGVLTLEGRADEVINLGGPKINPAEIDAILARHPDVVEAAAFGVKDGDSDFLLAAVVVRGTFNEQALLQYCRDHLGARAPRQIFALPALPRNASGKVIRAELARRAVVRR